MANTVIQLKYSSTPSSVPTSLADGELAINYADGKLYYKNATGHIVNFSAAASGISYGTINANNSLVVAGGPSSILTLQNGDNIQITSDIINDIITFTANLKPAFDVANAAYNYANTISSGGGGDILAGQIANAAFDKANTSLANVSNTIFDGTLILSNNGIIKNHTSIGNIAAIDQFMSSFGYYFPAPALVNIQEYFDTSSFTNLTYSGIQNYSDYSFRGSGTPSIVGVNTQISSNSNTNVNITNFLGYDLGLYNNNKNNLLNLIGSRVYIENSNSGNITVSAGEQIYPVYSYSTGYIDTSYGIRVEIPYEAYSGTIKEHYSLYIDDPTQYISTETNFSIYAPGNNSKNYFGGKVSIGTTSNTETLTIVGNASISQSLSINGVDVIVLANAAYDTANAAFNAANSASGSSAAYDTANAAFGVANSALANVSGTVFDGELIVSQNVFTPSIQIVNFDYISTGYDYFSNTQSFVVANYFDLDLTYDWSLRAYYNPVHIENRWSHSGSGGSGSLTSQSILARVEGGSLGHISSLYGQTVDAELYGLNGAYSVVGLRVDSQAYTNVDSALSGVEFYTTSDGVVNDQRGIYIYTTFFNATVNNSYGIHITTPENIGTSTVANNYGIYIDTQEGYIYNNTWGLYIAGSTANNKIEGNLQVDGIINASNILINGAPITTDISPAYDTANAAYTLSNATYTVANAAYDTTNAAFDKANSANVLAYNTGIGANNYAGVMANGAGTIANAAFDHSNATYTAVNSAFGTANAALPNTSGVTFAGDLTIPGKLYTGPINATNTSFLFTGYQSQFETASNTDYWGITNYCYSSYPASTNGLLFYRNMSNDPFVMSKVINNAVLGEIYLGGPTANTYDTYLDAIRFTAEGDWNDYYAANTKYRTSFYYYGGEAMRITGDGNIAIGTTYAGYHKMRIVGGDDNTLLVDNDGSQYTTMSLGHNGDVKSAMWFDNTASESVIWTSTNIPFVISANNTERMRIDVSGNVGIGTTSPGYKLDVVGAANISLPTLLVAGQNVLSSFESINSYAVVIGASGNAYTNVSTTAANNYAGAMANSVNAYTSTTYSTLTQFGSVFGVANAAYVTTNAGYVVANASFNKANSALANATGTFAGDLTTTGNVNAVSFHANTYIDFDQLPYNSSLVSYKRGRLWYDSDAAGLQLESDSVDFPLSMGEREWVRCRNNSGIQINKGQPVYITGVHIPGAPIHGHHPTIALADASDVTKKEVIGLAGHDIPNGTHGYVVVRGWIANVNTSMLTTGTRVHLGFAAPGTLVNTAPEYPNYPMDVGTCLTSDSTVGALYVHIFDHSFERIRVENGAYIDGSLTVEGDFTVLGTQTITNIDSLSLGTQYIYLSAGDSISNSNVTFTGSGLNDIDFKGHYEGVGTTNFWVKITEANVTGDYFSWSYDNFSTVEASNTLILYQTNQLLSNGISVYFQANTGHTIGNKWNGSATGTSTDFGFIGNHVNGGEYTHAGMFRDATDGTFKFFNRYNPEPNGNIDISNSTFTLGNVSVRRITAYEIYANNTDVGSAAILASDRSNGAFDKANSANVLAYNTGIGANAYTNISTTAANNYSGTMANAAGTISNSAFEHSNLTYTAVNSAFGVINAAFTQSNTDNVRLSAAYVVANAAFDKANSANVLAYNTGIGANNWSNTYANTIGVNANNWSNAYSNTIGVNANTYANVYANTVGVNANNWSNAYSNTIGVNANTYANVSFFTIANGSAAFTKANGSVQTAYVNHLINGLTTLTPTSNNAQINIGVGNVVTLIANTINNAVIVSLPTSGVTATTYGGDTYIPTFTVDAYGRITSASNVSYIRGASVNVGNSPPVSSSPGDFWWNTDLGVLFIYYTDSNSSQWVPSNPIGDVFMGTGGIISNTNNVRTTGSFQVNNNIFVANSVYTANGVNAASFTTSAVTARPGSQYDIAGNYIHAVGGYNVGGIGGGAFLFGDGSFPATIRGTPGAGYIQAYLNNNASQYQLWYGTTLDSNAAVLIGNGSNPQQTLDVRGNTTISGNLSVNRTSTSGGYAVDVNGTINAASVLVNGAEIGQTLGKVIAAASGFNLV